MSGMHQSLVLLMTQSGTVPGLSLILAATWPAMGIGKNGRLPWFLKSEMAFFRRATTGHTVVMGRRTWESIPEKFRPLPNRTNIVVSRNPKLDVPEGVLTATSLDEAISKVSGRIYIIGGAELYKAAISKATAIVLTQIHHNFDCDTFFEWKREDWVRQVDEAVSEYVGFPVEIEREEDGVQYTHTLWTPK